MQDSERARGLTRLSRRELLQKSAILGGVAAAAPLIAACSPSSTGPSASGGGPAGNVSIRVWGYGLDDARAKARLDVFTKANPKIEVQPVGGALNIQQLLTAVASGDPPEVINPDRSEVGSWAGRSAVDPIDDLVSRDKFDLGQFYPALVDQCKYKDKQYGVPQFANVDLLWFNNDVLKEAGIAPASIDPGNWDGLTSLGQKLYKLEGGKVTRTGFDTKMQDGRLWTWAWANGADDLISKDGNTAQFDNPKVIEALQWAKDTVEKQGGEKARAAFAQTQNFFSPQNPFLIGQTATTIFEQWLLGVLVGPNPNASFTTVLPTLRNSKTPITLQSGSALAIPHGVKGDKREAAWAFIKGMTSTEAWNAGAKATFDDRASKGMKHTPTISGNVKADQEEWNNIYKPISASYDAAVKLLPEALKAARFRYSGPVAQQVNDIITANVNDALQGVKSPSDAAKKMQADAQKAIDDYKKAPGNR